MYVETITLSSVSRLVVTGAKRLKPVVVGRFFRELMRGYNRVEKQAQKLNAVYRAVRGMRAMSGLRLRRSENDAWSKAKV